jgi:hypothetical protein
MAFDTNVSYQSGEVTCSINFKIEDQDGKHLWSGGTHDGSIGAYEVTNTSGENVASSVSGSTGISATVGPKIDWTGATQYTYTSFDYTSCRSQNPGYESGIYQGGFNVSDLTQGSFPSDSRYWYGSITNAIPSASSSVQYAFKFKHTDGTLYPALVSGVINGTTYYKSETLASIAGSALSGSTYGGYKDMNQGDVNPIVFTVDLGGGGGDTTAPTISEVTAISTYTNDTTPSYTFTTDEAGTLTTNITQGFSGGSSVSITGTGEQTVTFATLSEGTYSEKTITLTDASGNASAPLTIPTFTIDTTNPVITLNGSATTELTVGDTFTDPVTASDNPGTVDITGAITYGGTFNNTDTAGSYTRTYDVTDSAGNPAPQKTRNINVNVASTTIVITTTTFTAAENQTSIGTIGTTGGDGSAKTYEITGGADQSSFSISSSGVLTFNSAPDFETKTSYTIIVKVADTTYTNVTATITVNIDNVQEGLGATLPTISGTASEGGTLTASTTGISDPDNITSGFSYQWKRGASNIGTNSSTYGVVSADLGTTITVTVTYTDGKGDQQSLTSAGTDIAALDELTYFWTEYFADVSNNIPADSTLIHYGIYNTTKISGVQFTYATTTSPLTDVSYSIVDNSNNNTMIHKKSWPIHIINNTDDVDHKAMVFAGSVEQTINGMNTGVFAIVRGNITLATIVAVVDENSDALAASEYAIGEPDNPPEITEPGGRKLGDINFDGSVNSTDEDILEAYLLNDTTSTFTVYDDGTTNNGVSGKTADAIITDMTEYDWKTYVDVNNNNLIDVGDLVRLLSKIADPSFSMTNGT